MVYILLAPGFEEAEALVPVDMLRRANIETATVSITGEPVPGSHGVTVTADITLDRVDLSRADMIVLAGFLSILSPEFVGRWPERILNVHPALIPSFCGKGMYGLRVHEAALHKGVKVTGATVHLVNEIPDGGRILLQKAVEVLPGDTPEVLQRRVMEQAEWVLLPQAAELVAQGLAR